MSEQRNCKMCLACGDDKEASVFCKQCRQYFCGECKKEQSVTPGLENHIYITVEEGISLELPTNCGICEKLKKSSKALKKCVECKLLLCNRCSCKHFANASTNFHTQTEDLSVQTENEEVNRVSFNEGTSYICEENKEVNTGNIKTETVYYIRFILLLIKGGSRVLRNILAWGLEKKKMSLEHFLKSNQNAFSKSKNIKREQMNILFPNPSKTSDIKKWDIQLLCFIILEYFSQDLSSPELAAVKKIREMRNDFQAHYSKASIDRNTFFLLWSELSLIMTTMGRKMIEYEQNKNNELISNLCSPKLDMNSAAEQIKTLDNADEFNDTVQQCLNDVLGMNIVVKQNLEEIKSVLHDLNRKITERDDWAHTRVVNTVYGAVHVHARQQDIVDKAEAELLAASCQNADGTNLTANSEITKEFNKLKDDIEESGVKLHHSDKGSIIFTFESHSPLELLKLIEFFENSLMQMHLERLSKCLQGLFGERINLTSYLLPDSLYEALRKFKMKFQDHKKTVRLNMTCTGIEGLQQALKIFEEGGASNSWNRLSEILSDSIGDTITLETSIDMEQLQHAIVIIREQLALPDSSHSDLLMSKYSVNIGEETGKLHKPVQVQETHFSKTVQTDSIEGESVYPSFNGSYSSRSHSFPGVEKEPKSLPELDSPGKPEAIEISSDTVALEWKPPSGYGKGNYYQVYFTNDLEPRKCKWRKCHLDPTVNSVTLTELKTDTTYFFRVRAVYLDDEGPYSPKSDAITTTKSLALRLLSTATILKKDTSPMKYLLRKTEIVAARNEINKTKKFEIGMAANGYIKSKTILLVGATGTGKSTLVDGIANYALGVNWEDSFRLTILDLGEEEKQREGNQALSQTDWITCYTINPEAGSRLVYQLNIIDTPGFGDTAGPYRDKEIVSQLRTLFKEETEPKGVTYIDAACFLIKSPDARLTVFQKYVFASVMALFGKDMEKNICYCITFADSNNPPVLAAMKEIGLPQGETFSFNNSGLFETNVSKDITNAAPLFWQMGFQSFRSFFEYIERTQSRSLQQTKEVLEQRYELEETVSHLQPLLDLGLSKVSRLKQEIQILEDNFSTIMDNKHFKYEVEEMRKERRELPCGQRATYCRKCTLTCHEKCTFEDKGIKFRNCLVFDNIGKCKVCPNKCIWSEHESATFRLDYVQVKVNKEYENMRRKYEEASGKVLTQQQVIDGIGRELEITSKDIEYLMFVVKSCTDKLSAIALQPNSLNMTEYIDLIIENEKHSRKEGYKKRIKVLKEFRRKAGIQQEFEKFNNEVAGILETIGQKRPAFIESAYEKSRAFLLS